MFGSLLSDQFARRTKFTSSTTRLCLESLEARRLLATDIEVTQASHGADGAVVEYEIREQAATAFEITAYESVDGIELGTVLDSVRVDAVMARQVGEHAASLSWESQEVAEDHVVIVLDSASEVAELNELNNYINYELPTAQDPTLTIESVTENSAHQILLRLTLNGVTAVSIDWGYGNSEFVSDVGDKIIAHHEYPDSGSYSVMINAIGHEGQEISQSTTINARGQKPVIKALGLFHDSERSQWVISGSVSDTGVVAGLQVIIEVNGEEYFSTTDKNGDFTIRTTTVPREVTAKVMDADDWWSDVLRWTRD